MIEFGRSYIYEGKTFATLAEAQVNALASLLQSGSPAGISADSIVAKKDEVLAILTLTDASRPKARGVKKPRKAKGETSAATPAA